MRIVYVAKHDQSTGNDDEGAIHHALTELGHDVQRVREVKGRSIVRGITGDLLLFHHWRDWPTVKAMAGKMVRAFWCFDLVEYPDPTLEARNEVRREWMREAMESVEVGFCTDGDWAAKHPAKLHWLMQGADERVIGRGNPSAFSHCEHCEASSAGTDILFTGSVKGGGTGRNSFVDEMKARWGSRFRHVVKGVHRRDLADLIAGSKIVVAPDHPVTDRYWSNRVWNVLGFGGFLLHPWSAGLAMMYGPDPCMMYYKNRDELHQLIEEYLQLPSTCKMVSQIGMQVTQKEHTYRHRCVELLRVVGERTGVK